MSTGRQRVSRRQEVYQYICTHIAEHNRPPSYREIMEQCGYRSMAGVQFQLEKLARQGLITRSPFTARGIEVANSIPTTDERLIFAARDVVRSWEEGNLGRAIRRLAKELERYDGTV
jgi:SOS-response transcriptional repressor LexA